MPDPDAIPPIRPVRSWVTPIVMAGTVLLLLILLVPAINEARNAAQHTESKNILKQIGLAAHNYHDVYGQFTIGGDILPEGTAKHGWYTRLMPYSCSSPLYSRINFDVRWDHPENQALFQRPYCNGEIYPASDQRFSAEDYGLLHYMGNPNVLHRNSSVSLEDMTDGASNRWLVGEICGDYQPWAYPFNWRELKLPFNNDHGFGNPLGDETSFAMADGSVKSFSNAVDPIIIEKLANAPPVASAAATARPPRKFQTQSERSESHPIRLSQKDGTEYVAE